MMKKIDLKPIYVPLSSSSLFMENAIWHGIEPWCHERHILISVCQINNDIKIIVDGNRIARQNLVNTKQKQILDIKARV